ncbi:MAG: class I SAM-dependent methyltransferase [Candidatus Hodarchaeota archaeon]
MSIIIGFYNKLKVDKMDSESMKPYGMALLDYFYGDTSSKVIVYRDDGYKDELKIDSFFRDPLDFLPMEKIALDLCYGRILDIGAGAGPHSLFLQNKGLNVCAIDISPEACEIMKKRGIKNVCCIDALEFKAEPFDSIIIFGRSIVMVGTLKGLDFFLEKVHRLVKPSGQILLNSLDVRCTNNPVHLAYQEMNKKAGRYIGELNIQFEYKGKKGPFFELLHVDSETLINHALEKDWVCQIIHEEKDGNYLAKLNPMQ